MMKKGPVGKLWTLPSGCNFAAQLAAGLLRRYEDRPEDLGRVRLLLPTRRACRALQTAFLEQTAGRPLLLPRMHPLGDVDEVELSLHLSGFGPSHLDLPPAMPALRRQILLARLLTKHPDLIDKSYAHAFALAKSLGDVLDEMQTEGIDTARLRTLVSEQAGYSEHWATSLQFLQILDTVWPDQLAAHTACDGANRRREMMLQLASHWQAHPPNTPIIAAGTTGSIPATANLLRVILDLPQGEVILPGLDVEMDQETWQAVEEGHPQFTLKSLLRQLHTTHDAIDIWPDAQLVPNDTRRDALWREVMRPHHTTAAWQSANIAADSLDGLSLLEADTPEQEAQAIALTLREAIETPGQTAALITPDRALAARVTAALHRWNITVDDSAGQQLHLTLPGQYLLSLLRLAQHPQDKITLLQCLYNPLCTDGPALAQILDTPDFLRRPEPLHTLETPAAFKTLMDHLSPLVSFNIGLHPPHILLETMLGIAEYCAHTEGESGAARLWCGEDGEALAHLCAEWMSAMDAMPPMRLTDFTDIFHQLLQQSRFRPPVNPGIPRLRILGQIEARLQQADIMILAGLNEGTWPATPPADPWLSRQMRDLIGLPLPERGLTLSAHDFVQAASAQRVLLTRSKRGSDGTPATPSRWLQRLDAICTLFDLADIRHAAAPLLYMAAHLDRPAVVRPTPPPTPTPPLAARPRRYSVSDIGLWVNDPYALYAKKILGLRPWDDLGTDTTARDSGNILHKILEMFFKQVQDLPQLPPNAAILLHDIASEVGPPLGLDEAGLAGWHVTIDRMITSVTATQQSRMANGWRSVVLEKSSNDVALAGITLHGRADRIDRHKNGDITIIDYKARGSAYAAGKIADGHYPQLGVEALMAMAGGWDDAAKGTVTHLDYWYLKTRDADKMVHQAAKDIARFIQDTSALVHNLADTYLHDEMQAYHAQPYGPDLAADDYAYLARVSEWSLNAEKDTEEEGEDA